ncbi:MAG: DCC1-like thiol-disulfide oxidoreductase family protein [Acidobacteriota bacterium]|nr:DCC1-like thiol-disulfide oxidoreductase family protein [Acidobacteriota bacterium]
MPTLLLKVGLMVETTADAPVLLYDGVCGFCNKTVQMILARDRRGAMRFAALQSDYGSAVVERHPELRGVDSVVYVEHYRGGDERVYVRSDAALRVLKYLGGAWKLLLVAYVLPKPVRDFFYDLFARNRYRMFGKFDSCMLPPPEVRSRFLDAGPPAD